MKTWVTIVYTNSGKKNATQPCPFPVMVNEHGRVTKPQGDHFSGRNFDMILSVFSISLPLAKKHHGSSREAFLSWFVIRGKPALTNIINKLCGWLSISLSCG